MLCQAKQQFVFQNVRLFLIMVGNGFTVWSGELNSSSRVRLIPNDQYYVLPQAVVMTVSKILQPVSFRSGTPARQKRRPRPSLLTVLFLA